MQIRQLEGFSRVSTESMPLDGFSRVTYNPDTEELALGGLELQGCINRCQELDGVVDDDGYVINGLELQGLVQGYADAQMTPDELDEWEFLLDIEHPETMNGIRDWLKKRRASRPERRIERSQKKNVRKERRYQKRKGREENKAARMHKREQKRALKERRKAVRVARKEERLKRKMLRQQSKADARRARSERPGFFENVSEAVKSAFGRGDDPLMERDYMAETMSAYGLPDDMTPEDFSDSLADMDSADVTEMYRNTEDMEDTEKGYLIGTPPFEPWRGKWWGSNRVPMWQKIGVGVGLGFAADATLNQGKIRKSITKAITGRKK